MYLSFLLERVKTNSRDLEYRKGIISIRTGLGRNKGSLLLIFLIGLTIISNTTSLTVNAASEKSSKQGSSGTGQSPPSTNKQQNSQSKKSHFFQNPRLEPTSPTAQAASGSKEGGSSSRSSSSNNNHYHIHNTTIPYRSGKMNASVTVYAFVNGSSGSINPSFEVVVHGNQPYPSLFTGRVNGTAVTLLTGNYSITEKNDGLASNYKVHESADCSGIINAGQSKRCIITNSQ